MSEIKSLSLSSTNTASNNSIPDQHRPLIVGSTVDKQQPDHMPGLLQSTAKRLRLTERNRYSMGVDGDKQLPADTLHALSSDRCCCGVLRINTSAYLIAFIELAFLFYHLFLAVWSYDKTGDDYAFSFILGIFCMGLALVAVILLLVGIRKSSAYFLVPHLLMQFAIIVSWTLLAGYLILLMVGGTSIKFNGVIYEDSPKGRLGLANVDRREPIKTQVHMRELNLILVLLLGFTVLVISLQIWFFTIIRRCFALLRRKAIDKPSSLTTVAHAPNDHRV